MSSPPNEVGSEADPVVDSGSLPDTMWIDMVELGSGCAYDCRSCGAFEGLDPEDRKVKTITLDDLRDNLSQEIVNTRDGTRVKLADLLRKYVTGGVDMEPLGPGIYPQAAELIHALSNGRSRLVAISHGLSCNERIVDGRSQYSSPPGQKVKLEAINDLLLRDIVPLFVLTMDSARAQGLAGESARNHHDTVCKMEEPGGLVMEIVEKRARKDQLDAAVDGAGEPDALFEKRKQKVKLELLEEVSSKMKTGETLSQEETAIAEYGMTRIARREAVVETNARGYAETLFTLMPAIEAGKRVTISLQGDENKESLAYQGLARRILQRTANLLNEAYGMTDLEVNVLFARMNLKTPRPYVAAGRAKNILRVQNGVCQVIPDTDFVQQFLYQDPYRVTRGRIMADGTLKVQAYRPDRTYNDTVAPTEDNPWKVVRLMKGRVAVSVENTGLGRRLAAGKAAKGSKKKEV